MADNAIKTLRRAGLANPQRLARLISDTVASLKLDLRGMTVLTEAASGPFVVTPVIAAAAGARRIIALTRRSKFASVSEVIALTRSLEAMCGVSGAIEIHTARSASLFAAADIVTNLGFVRPLDRQAISSLQPRAVIALMCEAWELREEDVDIAACRARDLLVLATNESTPTLNIFAYSGWLCVKLLLEAGIEVHRNRILIASTDKFGKVIQHLLKRAGVRSTLTARLSIAQIRKADALVVADYSRPDEIIGRAGDVKPSEIAAAAPGITVVQFAGRVDVAGLRGHAISVHPGIDLPHRRMALTLGALGPRPVVELHAAGLKVAELAARSRGETRKAGGRFENLSHPIHQTNKSSTK